MNNKEFNSMLHNIKHGHFVEITGTAITSSQWRQFCDAVIDVSHSKSATRCAEYMLRLSTFVV